MTHDFAESLRLAAHPEPSRRLRGFVQLICAETGLDVAQVNAVNSSGKHTELTNTGYDDRVASYYPSERFTRGCSGFHAQLQRPDRILSWEDIPQFQSSYTAAEVLKPAGFKNGISALVRDVRGTLLGILNANCVAEEITPRAKATVADLLPTLADLILATRTGPAVAPVLSQREMEVWKLLAIGLTNRQIGETLFVSPRTVSTHVEHVLSKLGVSGRVQAATLAARSGLLA